MTVPQSYTRLFRHAEGKEVLNHLKKITFERTLSPAATDAELRFLEGQRALVALILSFIKQGQQQGENI
ncbi:MAG: hypothetical protein IKS41_00635 [Alphaproteobacteria bacterium]|nr:hypothetical protein [Alphaproteobacteria bacterium]